VFSKNFNNDIKHTFDGLRNIAICVSLLAGTPYIEKAVPLVCGSELLKFSVTSFYISVVVVLYILNLIWFFTGNNKEPRSKYFNIFSFIIISAITTYAIGITTYHEIIQKLSIYH